MEHPHRIDINLGESHGAFGVRSLYVLRVVIWYIPRLGCSIAWIRGSDRESWVLSLFDHDAVALVRNQRVIIHREKQNYHDAKIKWNRNSHAGTSRKKGRLQYFIMKSHMRMEEKETDTQLIHPPSSPFFCIVRNTINQISCTIYSPFSSHHCPCCAHFGAHA